MCDYSLELVKSRPAQVGDKLISHDFGTMRGRSRGFADANDTETAVCLRPGTELSFAQPVMHFEYLSDGYTTRTMEEISTAVFREENKDRGVFIHHDALELSNGRVVMVASLVPGQEATVLQLPVDELKKQPAIIIAEGEDERTTGRVTV